MTEKESFLIKPEVDAISVYFKDIGKHPLLTGEKEHALFLEKKQGDKAQASLARGDGHLTAEVKIDLQQQIEAGRRARQLLIESNLRLVVATAKHYAGGGMPLADLIQEGNHGLIFAIDGFDPHRLNVETGKPLRFSTYATWWIKQKIRRSLAEVRNVRIPEHVNQNLKKISRTKEELTATLGREPNLKEIAQKLGQNREKVREILGFEDDEVSLDQTVGENEESTYMDFIADEESLLPWEETEKESLAERIREILALLSPRERRILKMRYGFPDGQTLTLEEVGDELGITRERVRQIQAKAINKLRHPHRARSLKEY